MFMDYNEGWLRGDPLRAGWDGRTRNDDITKQILQNQSIQYQSQEIMQTLKTTGLSLS